MNKIITLFAILNCLINVTLAQSSYFMTFHSDKEEAPFDVIEDNVHNIVSVGLKCIQVSQFDTYKGMIWKIAANSAESIRLEIPPSILIILNSVENRTLS